MIQITVDEAYAFDMLAILGVKKWHNPDSIDAQVQFDRLTSILGVQIGEEQCLRVIASPEYYRLYEVNHEMYVRIDELKARGEQPGDAKYIDDRVYQRYLAKKALQEKWFPGVGLTEQKFGYGGAQ